MEANLDLETAIGKARTVVISIFNRFGDGIIAASVTNDFIKHWSFNSRHFVIVTSPQLLPYLQAICTHAEVIAFKRKNPFHWLRLWWLKQFRYNGFDIGLNPLSYGKISQKIAQMARWNAIYTKPKDALFLNLYDQIRLYLKMPTQGNFETPSPLPIQCKRILFCPESSEPRRTLTRDQMQTWIKKLSSKWPDSEITIAASSFPSSIAGTLQIRLKKSKKSSANFIKHIKKADVLVAVDSGPLHIAMAFGIPSLALFSKAPPSSVLNKGAKVFPLRSEMLAGVFCEKKDCANPVCMNELSLDVTWHADTPKEKPVVVHDYCPYLATQADTVSVITTN